MFTFNSLVQKAHSLIDPSTLSSPRFGEASPSKAALFRLQFRLPDSQTPLLEITAELSLPTTHSSRASNQANGDKNKLQERGSTYVGKLHLSENFLCFSTQPTSFQPSATTQASSAFTGLTQGAGPAGNGFTLPLCAIRRVERLQSPNSLFALALTTWNGFTTLSGKQSTSSDAQRFTVQLAGSRQASERFCDGLKRGLRNGIKEVESLKAVTGECYSEYLLSGATKAERDSALKSNGIREPPDAGLGMLFRYPGDAKKLREQSKMRLWREYFRGKYRAFFLEHQLIETKTTVGMLHSSDNPPFTSLFESVYQIVCEERFGSSHRDPCSLVSNNLKCTSKRYPNFQAATLWLSMRLRRI